MIAADSCTQRRRRGDRAEYNLHAQDVPEYLRTNPFIVTAYRRPTASWRDALITLFRVHNETANVWSHLLGFLAQACFTVYFVTFHSPSAASSKAKWPLVTYQACDMFTLLASSTAHLLCCLPQRVNARLWQLDHVGIVVGLTGEAFPFVTALNNQNGNS